MLPTTPSWGGSARKVLREARVRDRFQRLTTRVRTGPEYAERREIQRRRDERQDVINRGYRQFREWVTVETLPQKRLWRLGKLFAKYIRKHLIEVDLMSWYLSSNQRRFEPMMSMTPENWSRCSRGLAELSIAQRARGWSLEQRRRAFQDEYVPRNPVMSWLFGNRLFRVKVRDLGEG
jgi:hypothetical protein